MNSANARRRSFCLAMALAGASLALTQAASAQEPAAPADINAYTALITQAQTALEAGKLAEAKAALEKTNAAARSFEYDYLTARLNSEPATKAPDLIKKIAVTEIETRYGVLSPIARQVVFICRDGSLRIYDLQKPEEKPQVVPYEKGGAIWTGAFSHDGKTFAAGHENGEVVIWDATTWKQRNVIKIAEGVPVREIAVAPDGSAIVAEGKSSLELWTFEGESPKKVADLDERYNFGEGLAYSPKGDLIATGGMFDINLHDAKTGAQKSSVRHASYTLGLEFSSDGKRIASAPRGNVNKFLSVFDIATNIETAKPLFTGGPFAHYIAGLAFTPDGKRVIATGPIQDVRLFDATTGTVILKLTRGAMTARPSISHDGKVLGWCEQNVFCYIDLGEK